MAVLAAWPAGMKVKDLKRGDRLQVAIGNRKDAAQRPRRAAGSRRVKKNGRAGRDHDGSRKSRRKKDSRPGRKACFQRLLRLSLCVVHLGERRDRAWNSIGEAGVESWRYCFDRLWR